MGTLVWNGLNLFNTREIQNKLFPAKSNTRQNRWFYSWKTNKLRKILSTLGWNKDVQGGKKSKN